MKKVEFLTSAAGVYGVAHTGDKLILHDKLAKDLEEKGTVKISGDASESAKESIADKGSFRISDNTGKKTPSAGETNEKDVTGPDVKEKNDKAGPRGAKKK